jgi:hypothetical protein
MPCAEVLCQQDIYKEKGRIALRVLISTASKNENAIRFFMTCAFLLRYERFCTQIGAKSLEARGNVLEHGE